jgi:transcription elongation factor GreB
MKLIVTKQSFQVRSDLNEFYRRERDKAEKDRKEAASQGDLSENFGYVAAKEMIQNIDQRLASLNMAEPAEIVDPLDWAQLDMSSEKGHGPRAMLGAMVTIKRDGEEETFLIGGAWDADLDLDNIVPYTSPLAKILIPKAPGHTSQLGTGARAQKIEIISARPATLDELKKIYPTLDKIRTKEEKKKESVLPGSADSGMSM